ncbi:hypothetical protein AOLI_G00046380 [Acnodon oligacanthus]
MNGASVLSPSWTLGNHFNYLGKNMICPALSTDFFAVHSQTRNRTYLLCPVCKKTQWSLPVHLRRSCMKNSPGMDIERTVDAAKREANELLRQDHVWEYVLIRKILDNPDPVSRMIKELQDGGNVVVNIPPERSSSCHSSHSTCSLFSKRWTSSG